MLAKDHTALLLTRELTMSKATAAETMPENGCVGRYAGAMPSAPKPIHAAIRPRCRRASQHSLRSSAGNRWGLVATVATRGVSKVLKIGTFCRGPAMAVVLRTRQRAVFRR